MHVAEYERLMAEFGTERFNLHPTRYLPLIEDLPSHIRERIYIENLMEGLMESDLEGLAGICLDISHLEDVRRLNPDRYDVIVELLTRYPLGANHMSVSHDEPSFDGNQFNHSCHDMADVQEYAYLNTYPLAYFTDYAAIELNNSIAEQLEAKKYIEDLLAKKS
jgi:hypothetical protein